MPSVLLIVQQYHLVVLHFLQPFIRSVSSPPSLRITMLDRVVTARDPDEIGHSTTLGHLRLRNEQTNEIILIPTPSTDPNDPLNW